MEVYVVGGAVRNVLMGKPPKDLDFCVVGTTPEEMIRLGFKPIPASSFPVFHDADGNECALARTERKTGEGCSGFECHYSPDVTLSDDLYRRDLTINAMAVPIYNWEIFCETANEEYVIDEHNGLNDLKNGVIRHISSHFSEDPLRVLRCLRFAATYKFRISKKTSHMLHDMVSNGELDHLTPERIWLEFYKVFIDAKGVNKFLEMLDHYEILSILGLDFEEDFDHDIIYNYDLIQKYVKDDIVEMSFLATFAGLSYNELTVLQNKIKFPSHLMKLVLKYHTLMEIISDIDNLETIVTGFGSLNMYQQYSDFEILLGFVSIVHSDKLSDVYIVKSAFEISREVSFADLNIEQKTSLQGSQIGDAIKQLKIQKISNMF